MNNTGFSSLRMHSSPRKPSDTLIKMGYEVPVTVDNGEAPSSRPGTRLTWC
jgi:hypothetical protein